MKPPSHIIKSLLLLAGLATASSLSAAVIDFDVLSDYQNNFWSPIGNSATSYDGTLQAIKRNTVGTTTLIYNTGSTGGTGNLAGTAGGTPLDKFSSFTVQADFRASTTSANNSIGFYTKLNDSGTSGYLGIFRLNNGAGSADFRLWSGADATVTNGIGTGTQVGAATGTFAATSVNTSYTVKLEVADIGGNVEFVASLWTIGGTQIGSSISYTAVGGTIGDGQVGMRLNSNFTDTIRMDNFGITATTIPEPSTYAVLGGLAALGLAAVRRRRVC